MGGGEGKNAAGAGEGEGTEGARRRIAQAEADARGLVKGALGERSAASYLIALKYLESLEKISDGQATKIFLPFEASGILGALGGIREILAADGEPSVGPRTDG